MQEPDKWIVEVIKLEPTKICGAKNKYVCSDGVTRRPMEIERWSGQSWETTKKRIYTYGALSKLVFYEGRIPGNISKPAKINHEDVLQEERIQEVNLDRGNVNRYGETLTENTYFDNMFFDTPPPANGPYLGTGVKVKYFAEKEDMPGSEQRKRVVAYVEKMRQKGFVNDSDFNMTNNPLLMTIKKECPFE